MNRRGKCIRIGGGGAGAEDRLDPAVELVEKGDLDYICFDSLSEAELSIIASNRIRNTDATAYDSFMDERLRRILPACHRNGIRIIGNMGGMDPLAAQRAAAEVARSLGITGLKIAAVTGDNVLSVAREGRLTLMGSDATTESFGNDLISAHAYIPCDGIVEALEQNADIVITGRVCDASLFLAPMIHEFKWGENWDLRARGIIVGHLLECGAQVTGGYFADPPYKVVPNMHRIGFPIAEIYSDGEAFITKVEGSGGIVSPQTCREQMLYEVSDPTNYIEADVVTDFSDVDFELVAPDRVKIVGTVKGKPQPESLKVSLGVQEGFMGAGTVFYGGPGALGRAKLAAQIIEDRVRDLQLPVERFATQLLGVSALYGDVPGGTPEDPWEVGLRAVGISRDRDTAVLIAREASTALSNNGPAAVSCRQRQYELKDIVGYHFGLYPRSEIQSQISYLES